MAPAEDDSSGHRIGISSKWNPQVRLVQKKDVYHSVGKSTQCLMGKYSKSHTQIQIYIVAIATLKKGQGNIL